jgi:NAD-dependent SIR2 family protein deacetylase
MAKKKKILTPTHITQKRLARIFKDIKKQEYTESKFCFLLGAGASNSSGIKTGWELAQKWYEELKEDLTPKELAKWEKSLEGFHEDKIG